MQVLARLPGVEVTALCDPARPRLESMGRRYGVTQLFDSVDDLVAAQVADAVHVLVPPGAHLPAAMPCLKAGLHVLVEKPLALHQDEIDQLEAAAAASGAVLGVNHNQTGHPALVRLKDHLAAGRLGRLEHLSIVHNVPLRQLQSGDVGHFMFQTEGNILLEQGVHLFSVVHDLLGECHAVEAVTGDPLELPTGGRFFDEWQLLLRCERGTASVRMTFGKTMLETTVQAIGSDGAAFVDLARSACWLRGKSRWLEFLDQGKSLFGGSMHLLGRACGSVFGYGLSLFKLRFPDDPFLRGMRHSLGAFHSSVRLGTAPANSPAAARAVLQMCHDAARAAGASLEAPERPPVPEPVPVRPGEVVVLGGGGSIGKHCVRLLREQQRPVTMVVRRPQLLPAELLDGSVRIFVGDAADAAVLDQAFAGADSVLHLATCAGEDVAKIEATMASAVRTAAEAAQRASVRRMVYASSTAALYLGSGKSVTGDGAPDGAPQKRSVYGRGKIAAERELAALRDKGQDLVVVRPAIVLSPGGAMEHSGVGLWVRDNHCVGWGSGRNPLPLVLVDDCAQGLVRALHADSAKGHSYNLAGPVRLTAREFVAELRKQTGRDYHFHGTSILSMWLQEVGKHLVKVLARRPREFPSIRDLRSRSFRAPLDCSDAERDLGFVAETDRGRFLHRLFGGAKGSDA